MKKRISKITVLLSFVLSVSLFSQFNIGWYSPMDYNLGTHPIFACTDNSTTGKFSDIGINTLLAYKGGIYNAYWYPPEWPLNLNKLITATNYYLDLYDVQNQKIILDISSGEPGNTIFQTTSDITTYVNTYKNNSHVIGWYIADEPEDITNPPDPTYYSRVALISRYKLIKSLSNKPIFVALANTANFINKYTNPSTGKVSQFYDILMADEYPVKIGTDYYNIQSCRSQAQMTKTLAETDSCPSNIFYFITQGQGYNVDNNNGTGDTSWGFTDPDMHQMRYMVISPMIWGAKGILFWDYAHASRRGHDTDPADSWKTVHRFTQWFKASSFYGNLGNIYGTNPETTDPSCEGYIHYRTKYKTQNSNYWEFYIFSVNENTTPNPFTGYVKLPVAPSGNWSKVAVECAYDANNPGTTININRTISTDYKITLSWYRYEIKIFWVKYTKLLSKESFSIGNNNEQPFIYKLDQNYPNPFNPTTNITYELPDEKHTYLAIYNVMGEKIIELVNETKTAGSHTIQWDGLNENGKSVPGGIYIAQIISGEFTNTIKMLLIK